MSGGSLQLHEYPGDLVRLSCEKCGRAGPARPCNYSLTLCSSCALFSRQ